MPEHTKPPTRTCKHTLNVLVIYHAYHNCHHFVIVHLMYVNIKMIVNASMSDDVVRCLCLLEIFVFITVLMKRFLAV